VQLKQQKPESFLADSDEPQIQLNRETMARYRPEMRKFYYDAARYDTYLEQLGVKFPQLTKAQ
jgi:aminobenzoyl-glutamate utilization protein B